MPIGPMGRSLTAFRVKNGEVAISYYYDIYSTAEFLSKINNSSWSEKQKNTAKLAIDIAIQHINTAPDESDNKKCPFCGGDGIDYDEKVKCNKCAAIASKDFWNKRN